jgi:galactokinase
VAPGRVNLIGEHVDYNDGWVLPMAIERHVVVAGGTAAPGMATIYSRAQDEEVKIPVGERLSRGIPHWANYIRGVLAGWQGRGALVPGFEAVVHSDLPLGGGLSSSAALEVATCRFLEGLIHQRLPDLDCIRLCQRAEHEFAGVPCGIMDQFVVTCARRDHALLLDCQSIEARHVPMTADEVSILITHSGVAHELGKGEYAKRRADCQRAARTLGVPSLRSTTPDQLEASVMHLDPVAHRRARHVITENHRTLEFARALERRDWGRAGELMYLSHDSLREDYEVSCQELDNLVAIARDLGEEQGVYGARLTGGGFGGCTVALVRSDRAEAVRLAMLEAYRRGTGINADSFISPAAAGARTGFEENSIRNAGGARVCDPQQSGGIGRA